VCVLINILRSRAVPFANGARLNKDYFLLFLGCGLVWTREINCYDQRGITWRKGHIEIPDRPQPILNFIILLQVAHPTHCEL